MPFSSHEKESVQTDPPRRGPPRPNRPAPSTEGPLTPVFSGGGGNNPPPAPPSGNSSTSTSSGAGGGPLRARHLIVGGSLSWRPHRVRMTHLSKLSH